MHMLFRFVWAIGCFKFQLPLNSYSPSLSLNMFWILPGSKLSLDLYRICAVLNSTKSLHFSVRDFKNILHSLFLLLSFAWCILTVGCLCTCSPTRQHHMSHMVEREYNIASSMIYSSVRALFCILSPQDRLTRTCRGENGRSEAASWKRERVVASIWAQLRDTISLGWPSVTLMQCMLVLY